jgi:nitroreductase
MNVSEAIATRRTIRKYTQKDIPAKVLEDLVNAGRLAPTARNIQPLEFVIVDPKGPLDLIFTSIAFGGQVGSMEGKKPRAYIVVLMNTRLKSSWFAYDCGIAVESISLAAWEKGIGSCILGDINRYKIADILKVPQDYNVELVMSLGYPDEKCVAEDKKIRKMEETGYSRDKRGVLHIPKRSLETVIHRNKF